MVFGIGLSKTGTHTLTSALEALGYRAIHYPDPRAMLEGRFEDALRGFNAATDISVSAFFRELDAAYPGSRFILTTRDEGAWLESVEDHRARRDALPIEANCPKAEIRRRLYRSARFDREVYRAALTRHARDVAGYFADRPGDLLLVDICARPAWEPICEFLRCPVPDLPFPHRNARRASSAR